MADAKTVWASIRDRIGREFKHAPVATIGAVVAIIDVAWRLTGGEFMGAPIPTTTPIAPGPPGTGLPTAIPLLEFVFFQIFIVFLLFKLNLWVSWLSASIRIAAGLLTAILAGFLTSLNAFYLTRFYISSEGKHYVIFEPFWVVAVAISVLFLLVLQSERDDFPKTIVGAASSVAITVGPMALVIILSCAFFDPFFMDRLESIWSATVNSASRPH